MKHPSIIFQCRSPLFHLQGDEIGKRDLKRRNGARPVARWGNEVEKYQCIASGRHVFESGHTGEQVMGESRDVVGHRKNSQFCAGMCCGRNGMVYRIIVNRAEIRAGSHDLIHQCPVWIFQGRRTDNDNFDEIRQLRVFQCRNQGPSLHRGSQHNALVENRCQYFPERLARQNPVSRVECGELYTQAYCGESRLANGRMTFHGRAQSAAPRM